MLRPFYNIPSVQKKSAKNQLGIKNVCRYLIHFFTSVLVCLINFYTFFGAHDKREQVPTQRIFYERVLSCRHICTTVLTVQMQHNVGTFMPDEQVPTLVDRRDCYSCPSNRQWLLSFHSVSNYIRSKINRLSVRFTIIYYSTYLFIN